MKPAVAILAGGLGTRLRPLTDNMPKALVPVAGKPFIHHQLDTLRDNNIKHVVICTGFLGEQISQLLPSGSRYNGMQIDVVRDGPSLLGTAGALRKAAPILGDSFFVLYGDSYLKCDYEKIEFAFRRGCGSVMMTVCSETTRPNAHYAHGSVLRYDKYCPTSQMKHIDYGLSIWKTTALQQTTDSDLALVYKRLADDMRLHGYEWPERYLTIGTPEGLAETETQLFKE